MALLPDSCFALVVEFGSYVWCNVVRLLFSVWFLCTKPRRVSPTCDELLLRSATSLAADIRNGKVKSVQVISAYIARIRQVQPVINAVVEDRFEEALKEAEAADRLVASGTMSVEQMAREMPLLGLPLSVKNSIAVKGLRQDAGSLLYKGNRADEDAPCVALLRAAGAIPLVLTNGDTKNLLDGTTRNPHDTRRHPGGSSGGEGSLIAAAGSLMGLGTDIGGSVRGPAAYCGIFGHKPTSGVVPITGLLPDVGDSLRQYNSVGPMTRYAEDLSLLFNILAEDRSKGLGLNDEVDLKSFKVYFVENEGCRYFSQVTRESQQAVIKVTRHMEEAHGIDVRRLPMPELQYSFSTWLKVAAAKDPTPLAELFRPGGFNVFVELLRVLAGAGRHTLAVLAACRMAAQYHFASKEKATAFVAHVESLRDRLEETLGDDGVLILPATISAAPFQNEDLLYLDLPSFMALFNLFETPATACPVSTQTTKDGARLPIAVQVVAKRGNDRLCFAVARELERKFGGWVVPGAAA
ncbi:fatty-acid amide hydrolase 2-A-like [Haemaphysalis longicornis]